MNRLQETLNAIHVAETDVQCNGEEIVTGLLAAESCWKYAVALAVWDPHTGKMRPPTDEDRQEALTNAQRWEESAVNASCRAYRSWRKLRTECQRLLDLTKD